MGFHERQHDGVRHLRGDDYLFYYGVKPNEVHLLRLGAKYAVVYTDKMKAVMFRVASGGEGKPNVYALVKERQLTPEEIEHFKALVAGLG